MTNDEARDAAMGGDATPRVLGSVVAAEILENMQTDGWNHLGSARTVEMKNGEVTPAHPATADTMCTGNCRPFNDTTEYKPQNSPWEITVPTAWQPLTENDGKYFFYTQGHVTPHIGYIAKPVILSSEEIQKRELCDPNYEHEHETDLVIEGVADLDDMQKVMIEFMDNKLNLAGALLTRLREEYGMSLEAQAYCQYGLTSSELDAVILAWKERVKHDLIKPTSTVHARGEEMVSSFVNGGEPHQASDWVPYLEVVPHAEYPSGSASICQAVAQYLDSFIQPGVVPGEDIIVTFNNMTELRDACGDSRLWGAMHFTASVGGAYELCDGVGVKGSEVLQCLLGDTNFESLMDGNAIILYGPTV